MEMLQEQVLSVLRQSGLIPPEWIYLQARAAITALGQEVASNIEASVGKRTWSRGLARLHRANSRDDMRRVLGFGAALTGYMISGLALTASSRAQVVELGAMTNLIVSLYDQFIDTKENPRILPPYALALAASTKTRPWVRHCAWMYPAPARLLLKLVTAYFNRLDALPCLEQRPQLKQSVLKTIYRMYLAERSTFGGTVLSNEKQLRRKSALPFVVMAVPAWLVAERFDAVIYRSHLRWLYHLGLLVGYVDDAVDILEDRRQGHANLFKGITVTADAIARVARLANMAKTPYPICNNHSESIATREALRTCIASWFGGSSVTQRPEF